MSSTNQGLFPFLKYKSMNNQDKIYYLKLYAAIILGTLAGLIPVSDYWVGKLGGLILLLYWFGLNYVLWLKYPLEPPRTYWGTWKINAVPGFIIYLFFWVMAYDLRVLR